MLCLILLLEDRRGTVRDQTAQPIGRSLDPTAKKQFAQKKLGMVSDPDYFERAGHVTDV